MSVFRPLYDWALRQAEKPHAQALLFLVALIEPCLFPIPPDTLLIPMAIARRDRAFRFATISTLGSVTGGVIGYGIGALVMATVGQWFITTYHLTHKFDSFQAVFLQWGLWIILVKSFVPLVPFMIVSVVSGATHFNLGLFIFAASITRGGRFFLEAALLYRYGKPVQLFIERYMTWIGLALLALVVGIVWFMVHE